MDRNAMIGVVGIGGVLVFVLIIAWIAHAVARKATAAWQAAAAANGLSFSGKWPRVGVSGTIEGISVSIRHERAPRRKSYRSRRRKGGRTSCHAEASIPGGTGDLAVAEEGLIAKLAQAVGFSDVEIGDPRFDKRFKIKTQDPERAKQLLVPAVRESLLALEGNLRGEISIADSRLRWRQDGSMNHERAIEVLRRLAAAARRFS